MESSRASVVLRIFVLSLAGLALFMTVVNKTFAASAEQNIIAPDIAPDMVSATTTNGGAASYPVCTSFEAGVLPSYFFTDTTSSGAANGRVAVTTAFPHSGSWGLDLDTDCNNCGGATQQAAIMVVDLAGQADVLLDFWVYEHFDENNPEDGVFISDDGGATWALVQSLQGFPAGYQQVILDLDAAVVNAGMSYVSNFMIRFQSVDGATIPGNDGYSFDDICVQPAPPEILVDLTELSSAQPTNQVITHSMTISNVGTNLPLQWAITEADTDCNVATPVPWANAAPISGTVTIGNNQVVNVSFDSTGLTPSVYNGLLCINSNDPTEPQVSVSLVLTVENTAPVAVGESYTTTFNTTLEVPAPGVLANDSDLNSDTLTAVLDNDVSNGTLNLNSDGSFTYTPTLGFVGEDSFTYYANDGTDDSNIVTVNIVTIFRMYLPIVPK
ncbi:MAG: cadherin-like domain-containing protein, partial [Anaerolineales bacterium]|nr:cadherin-like domain-containing protein [Anaerolineales bacterium]